MRTGMLTRTRTRTGVISRNTLGEDDLGGLRGRGVCMVSKVCAPRVFWPTRNSCARGVRLEHATRRRCGGFFVGRRFTTSMRGLPSIGEGRGGVCSSIFSGSLFRRRQLYFRQRLFHFFFLFLFLVSGHVVHGPIGGGGGGGWDKGGHVAMWIVEGGKSRKIRDDGWSGITCTQEQTRGRVWGVGLGVFVHSNSAHR